MRLDELFDGTWRTEADTKPFAHSATKIGAAEIDNGHFDLMIADLIQSFLIGDCRENT